MAARDYYEPDKDKNQEALCTPEALMIDILNNSCGRYVYDSAHPDTYVINDLREGRYPIEGRKIVVYKYDAHCMEYEVHVDHDYPNVKIVKVLKYG